MANAMYDLGREGFLDGSIDWDSDTIKVVLVDASDYTPNMTTDKFLSDIASGGRVAISAALTSKTVTLGVANAAAATFTAVTGDQSEYLILFKDTGSAATSRLIALIDTATGLPYTPNGADLTVNWDTGSNKIFKL